MPETILSDLFKNGVAIFDGAMGTEIYRRDVLTNRCFDELCLTDPDIIRTIHVEYANAGADVLQTNSFGANRISLSIHGLADKVASINQAAVALAREVADGAKRPVFVAGSVGPVPGERSLDSEPVAALIEQVGCLIEAGADLIMFETQPRRRDLERCAAAMAQWPHFPYILSATVFEDAESAAGETVESLFASLAPELPPPLAWGMNCGTGPDGMLTAVERVVKFLDRPLIVMPNAGTPKEIGRRQIYLCSPDYIAGYAKRYLDLGVRGIGGCCGTTPDHIREIARRIKPLAKQSSKAVHLQVAPSVEPQEPAPFGEKSRLAWRLANHKWVRSVELVPPRGYDLADIVGKARALYRHGVDAVNIPDGPRASSRISPLITALNIQREAQIETVLHFSSRDRNLIGIQADLLACAASEVRNILFVTGDPPKLGQYPFASGVFDMDAIGMCAIQKRLNQGIDLGGQAINPKTQAAIGVGVDPTALDLDREIGRFTQKAEAGAEFAMSQPVFDIEGLLRFLDRVQHLNVPIIAGIWPLASYRNATFLQNEVPGVRIPEQVMARMALAESKEDQLKTGIDIAREAIACIRDRVAGVQVSAPFGNIQTALAVIR